MRRVAAGDAGNHPVLHNERSAGDVAAALVRILDFDLPDFAAGLGVERDQVIVHRTHENQAMPEGDTAVPGPIERHFIGCGIVVVPDLVPADRVDREDAVPGASDVHDAVGHERRAVEAAVNHTGLEGPGGNEILNVCAINLVERTITPRFVGTAVGEPVLRFAFGLLEPLAGDFSRERKSGQRNQSADLRQSGDAAYQERPPSAALGLPLGAKLPSPGGQLMSIAFGELGRP